MTPEVEVVVGGGGVGKTTVAAALGARAAGDGDDVLVMTFDPSMRLKDALGVGEAARERPVAVDLDAPGRLDASLLDARHTFDRLVQRYAPDEAARRRILENRFYHHLAGHLSGTLEYMAVERLFEAAIEGGYSRIILDTPPTRQALDFLEAPQRIIDFLDSGAVRMAMKPWFDDAGHLRAVSRLGFLGRSVERLLDDVVGLDLLRDMAEFFRAFGPLYDGFRQRATEVEALLRSERTRFLLVTGPGPEQVPETMFFARRLREAGYHLQAVVVNRLHPVVPAATAGAGPGAALMAWLGERDARGLEELQALFSPAHAVVPVPLLAGEPTDLARLADLAAHLDRACEGRAAASGRTS